MLETKKKSDTPAVGKSKESQALLGITLNRESVESVVVAVILALLFRAFVAEAFVIPTGSMAPTLMGRHVDVWCDQCGYHDQGGGSSERNRDDTLTDKVVATARCPNCGFRKDLETTSFFSNERSFSGDRIIVSKFAYELGDPERWDVIVFKFPGEAQQNYIKRLIGLPGETIKIHGGNIYVQSPESSSFEIARKPDAKLLSLLQIVHDSDYAPEVLIKGQWPKWWQAHTNQEAWNSDELGKTHALTATDSEAWLRYHHVDPSEGDWRDVSEGEQSAILPDWSGRLISDFYAYNSTQLARRNDPDRVFDFHDSDAYGQYWVDDLAVECEVELAEATGEVLLDLVRGGAHYTCRIDSKLGQATLSARTAEGQPIALGDGEQQVSTVSATTSIRGPGTYRLRMSNVDHELRLWVNGYRITFPTATTYDSDPLVYPDVSHDDGDLAPAAVGGQGQALTVRHLRVLRDKYYIACRQQVGVYRGEEYQETPSADVTGSYQKEISYLLSNPQDPRLERMLRSRGEVLLPLEKDQFLPLGDNSPASSDARYWPDRHLDYWDGAYVDRRLLVGKALFIYWPHSWNMPPLFPNFRRMQPIR